MFSRWNKVPRRTAIVLQILGLVVAGGILKLGLDAYKGRSDSTQLATTSGSREVESPPPTVGHSSEPEVRVDVPDHAAPEIQAFRGWASEYLDATPVEKEAMEKSGIELAQKHTQAIAALIKSDPRKAIEDAVPMAVRQRLPEIVVNHLEQRVNVQGSLNVFGNVPDASKGLVYTTPPITRTVTTEDGRQWRAYTYGKRAGQGTRLVASLNGVAVGKDFAVSESPLRKLENGERPVANGRPVVDQCPISGIVTPVPPPQKGQLPPISPETPAFETSQRVVYICSGGHFAAVEEQLEQQEANAHWEAQGVQLHAGAGSGPVVSPLSVPTSWTTGQRKLLFIRATFPNHRVDPQSEAECHESLRQMCDYMVQASYGRCYFTYTVAPLIVLPYPESWYVQYDNDGFAGDSLIVNHARTAAKALGYDTAQYDLDVVRWNGVVGAYGGSAFVGAKGVRMKTNSVGTLCHELGHNLGMWHSNYWLTTPPSVTGPGENLEYGNIFDVMGSSGSMGHYTASFKNVIGWLPQETFWSINASGTYRLYQYDTTHANPDQRYAMRIKRDAERNYWCEFRQRLTGNNALMNGLMVTWDSWGLGGIGGSGGNPTTGSNGGAHLLDMTPGSFGNGITDTRNDSALYVGRTYSDTDTGVHVTPVVKNASTTPPSMDVVVNLGTFPGNQTPILDVQSSAISTSVGTSVTLTATASDPDNDTLAYSWSFDDGTYSTDNSAVQTKSWASAGHYRVLCTTSDMKGGRTTMGVTITVGSPTTFVVSGQVTGPGGLPVEGAYVSNYAPSNLATHPNSATFRGTWTDSDGNYVLTRVSAGSRTMSATLYPKVFTASGFSNPLNISGNVSGINFTGTSLPVLTITTPDDAAAEAVSPNIGTVRISRSGSTAAALSVQVFNASTGTATRTADYTLSPTPTAITGGSGASEFIIPAGATSLDITITPVDDTQQEGVEYAVLDFANTSGGYTISGPSTGVVTITDNESSLPVVKLSAIDLDAAEAGTDSATLKLERTGSTAANLVVNITYTGTATQGSDFTASTSVTIPSGSSTVNVPITPINDVIQEGTETIIATLASNASYQRDTLSSNQTLVLMDNDTSTVSIVANDASASENGPDTGTFTITRTGGDQTQPLTVDYSVSGRAVMGADYLRLDGRAVIPAGADSCEIVIQPVNDTVSEGTQDVICQLRSSTSYYVGTPDRATIDIADDDGPQVYVKLIASAGYEPASGSSTTVQFQIIRPVAGPAITVNYTVGGTATPGMDYTALPGSVSFGATETSKTIVVSALSDTLMENAESVILTLQQDVGYSLLAGQDTSATGFILDQDQPTVDVSVADTGSTLTTVGTEATSSGLRFIISRRAAISTPLTVQYTMSGTATQGIDYTATSGSAIIPADATSVYVGITPVNDTTAEGVETLVMNITPQAGTYGLGIGSATMMLGDNDAYSGPALAFASSSSTVDEAIGSVNIPVNLTGSSGSASVRYRVSGGTATGNGKDYTLAEGVLSFSPGQSSRTITLAVQQDQVPEPQETVVIELFNAIGANLGSSSHTVTINNVSLPETWTDSASTVLLASATLNGHVNPNGLLTQVWFEYGGSNTYGNSTTPQSIGSGSTSVNVSAPISGLTLPGYHFRCVAQNSAGKTYGTDFAFGVDAAPAATTLAATNVTSTGATVHGTVNANSLDTTPAFECGTTSSLGTVVAATPALAMGTGDTAVSAALVGLAPNTTYYYRAIGTNASGTGLGNVMTFITTNAAPVAAWVNAPTAGNARAAIAYTASASDADGDTLTYSWDFGSGYPVLSGSSVSQVFFFGGVYNLTLTVSDGHGGTATLTRTITITDPARTWSAVASGVTNDLNAVAANGSTLVAVGDRGTIIYSTNGTTWLSGSIIEYPNNIYFLDVIYDGTKFMAVGQDYNFSQSAWIGVTYFSFDGISWQRILPDAPKPIWSIANIGGTVVSVGDSAQVLRATDGYNGTPVTIPGMASTQTLRSVAYAKGIFAFTSVNNNSFKVMTSPNGVTWTDRTPGTGLTTNMYMNSIAALNNQFVGSGYYGRVRTSTDGGVTFSTTRTAYEDTPALAYGDGIYFAGGVNHSASDADIDLCSLDGQTWYSAAAPTTTNRNDAAFFGHRFYTVGNSGEIWRSGSFSAAPVILTQPDSFVVLKGDSVQFSVFATGNSTLSYRWRKNGATIPGATAPSFSIASAKSTDTGTYDVVTSNSLGTVSSRQASLVVHSPAEIVTEPVGGNIIVGNAKVLSVVATGDEPLLYQWRKDGVPLDGKTSPSLSLTNVQVANSGNYDCVVTNDYGTDSSNVAFLNVQDKFLALSAASYLVEEQASNVTLPVSIVRTGNPTGTIQATLTMTNGTATVGSDYSPATVTVTVDENASSVDVPINILASSAAESNETFNITLTTPSLGTAVLAPSVSTVVIVDPSSLSDTLDKTVPSAPVISYPAANARVEVNTGGSLNITGTAADNKGVKMVTVTLNTDAPVQANLGTPGAVSTTYNLPVVPRTGLNTIQIQSVDFANRTSTIVTRSFTVLRPLQVHVDSALGGVSAGYEGTSYREVGKSLILTATPKTPTTSFAGAIFVGWIIGGQDEANGHIPFTNARLGIVASSLEKQTLTLIFREGLELTPQFLFNPFTNMAGTYNGLIRPSPTLPNPGGTVRTNATEGFFNATLQKTGAFSGKLSIDGLVLNVAGSFDDQGDARFGSARLKTLTVARQSKPSLQVTLKLDMTTPGQDDQITGSVTATEFVRSVVKAVSLVEADRAYYDGVTKLVPQEYLAGSSNANGTFTALFPPKAVHDSMNPGETQVAGLGKQDYPQGYGSGMISVTKAGVVSVTGTLADGSAITTSTTLSQQKRFALFAQLYNKLGFLSGFAQLDALQPKSDIMAPDLQWLRPFQSKSQHYPYGWPNGIKVEMLAAKFTVPVGRSVLRATNDRNLMEPTPSGNASLTFKDGLLTSLLAKRVNVTSADGTIVKVPDNDGTFTLSITRTSGALAGTLIHTDDTTVTYKGTVYQKGAEAGGYGYFLTKEPAVLDYTGESGAVILIGEPVP